LCVALFLFGAGAGAASAATIQVSTVQALQNTLSPACSATISPCAAAGDTVALAAGTYKPTATLDISVPVSLVGPASAPGAVLDGSSIVPDPTSGEDSIVVTEAGVAVTLTDLTLTNNADDNPAVEAIGPLTLSNSTIAANRADGIWIDATSTITNSTIAGNGTVATTNNPNGGLGILVHGALTLQNDTINGNGDHGLGNVVLNGPPVTVKNTIVGGNGTVSHANDCAMTASSSLGSLDGDHSCGVATTADPLLGALAANGGPTQTEAIPGNSPAVNGGDNASCPAVDQRGVARSDHACDIGAYEFVDTATPTITLPPSITAAATGPNGANVDFSGQISASDPDGEPMTTACTPAAGSLFPIGTTTVSCTATDTHAKTAAGTFQLVVSSFLGGSNCRSDGKISGRGGLTAAKALALLLTGFQNDVCGAVSDTNGATMGSFNYDTLTGSGIGIESASCRADAFAASDAPYTSAQLNQLDGSPGATGCNDFYTLTSPYPPGAGHGWNYPAPSETAGTLMTFPIASTSIGFGVNLTSTDCGGTHTAPIQLTTSMISRLMSGDIKTWDDTSLRAGGLNSWLANCHTAVSRIVRDDANQTTQNLKNYLVHADNNRSTATTCYVGGQWLAYANASFNTSWPGDGGKVCSPLLYPTSNGDAAQLSLCASTHGAICYADTPDLIAQSTLIRPSIRNATDTAYAAPSSGFAANCSLPTLVPPPGTPASAIGMNPTDSWATDNPSGDHGDVTFAGSSYPICELTYIMAYAGLKNGGTAVSELNYDQRRTLASFLTYILSEPAQTKLSTGYFQQLPTTIVATLRGGVQANA
jgi:hypothetical protein